MGLVFRSCQGVRFFAGTCFVGVKGKQTENHNFEGSPKKDTPMPLADSRGSPEKFYFLLSGMTALFSCGSRGAFKFSRKIMDVCCLTVTCSKLIDQIDLDFPLIFQLLPMLRQPSQMVVAPPKPLQSPIQKKGKAVRGISPIFPDEFRDPHSG